MILIGLLLGLVCVTPLVTVYALFIRWCDRFEPEPWWLLIGAFFFGAFISTLGGGIMNGISESALAAITGLPEKGDVMHAVGATVFAPICEEFFKGLGVLAVCTISWLGAKEMDGPLDGAIYGGIVGLGFTLTEDVLYVGSAFAENGVGGFVGLLVIRTIFGGLGHATYTACTGVGFGIAAESRNGFVKFFAPLGGYVVAMMLHGFHNGVLNFGVGGFLVMQLTSWIVDILFFVLLGLLVVRDRKIVILELSNEIGGLIHPEELTLVTTYVTIGFRNWATLFSKGFTHFRLRRKKQLALVEIAFIKSRRRRGEIDRDLDLKESKLRYDVMQANRQGIYLGG